MRRLLLVVALLLAPPGAHAADFVVWWEKGFYEQEDAAVAEIVAAFEQQTGTEVALLQPTQSEIAAQAEAALEAGQPPDFLFMSIGGLAQAQWAFDGHLAALDEVVGANLALFDDDAVRQASWRNGVTGERRLYALPMGRLANHLHVWRDLLERAGFTLADIPAEWQAFWSFWCDDVQPALRQRTGREDVWAVGLPMSIQAATDTLYSLMQFQLAYDALWLDRDGRLRVDDPSVRAGIVEALARYTEIWRKGCTPPDSLQWTNLGNNQAFLAQQVVMTVNTTLSIPAALRHERPPNAVTLAWPAGAHGQPLVIAGATVRAVVFAAGAHRRLAEAFVRFLVEGGWLAHWLSFAGDRYMPPMRKLAEQPFWLNPNDPHRMRAAMQILSQPQREVITVRDHERQSNRIRQEAVWNRAVQRVAAEGATPEQAVDEAIARIKQILAE